MSKNEISILLIGCQRALHQQLLEVLENRYQLKSIADFGQGISKAFKLIPDIILTCSCSSQDDGISICHLLKSNQLTSHIPIILILEDQPPPEEAYSYPADALVPFYFSKKEMMLGLQKAISLKIQLMKRYALFYDPENPFTREYSLLNNYIEQLADE